MNPEEINTLVEAMSGIATILRQADPTDKAEVYRQLGIKLTYKPGLRLIQAEASPNGSCTKVCPTPELDHKSTAAGSRGSCTKVCPEIDTNQYPISADLGSRPHRSLTATRLRRTPRQTVEPSKAAETSVGHHASTASHRTKCLPTWLTDYRALARMVSNHHLARHSNSDPSR